MAYSGEWRRKAIAETKQFWSTKRIAVAVVGPPVVGVLWAIFQPWVGWGALMQVMAISILGFFALWGVVFFVCLLEAPAQLNSEKALAHKEEIERLKSSIRSVESTLAAKSVEALRLQWELTQKHPHDEQLEREIGSAVARLDDRELMLLRWLMNNGRVERGKIQAAGFHNLQDGLNQKASFELLKDDPVRAANGTEIQRYFQINPGIFDFLRNVLYPPTEKA